MKINLILASASPRRKELLKTLGIPFRVKPSRIKEPPFSGNASPEFYALSLALAKAESVAENLNRGWIIGADTIVVFKKKIIGKPKNANDALRILKTLNHTSHFVYTGIAVIDAGTKKRTVDFEKTTVYTKKLPLSRLKELSLKHHDKAGAYAVQEKNDLFVKKLEGDYYNVVGFPLLKIKNILRIFLKTSLPRR